MSTAPSYNIDPQAFWHDPYPTLKYLRANHPIVFIPELQATLLTKHEDVVVCEKNIQVFSSDQPEGLMVKLMGRNMMRKDGPEHMNERKTMIPTISPATVMNTWKGQFEEHTKTVIDRLQGEAEFDLVKDFAMPVSAEALKSVTGLTNMDWREMDRVSQGMIDGCANYAGDPAVELRCKDCTDSIERHIAEALADPTWCDSPSLLTTQLQGGLPMESVVANIKLAISGGQNEPRDAIAGAIATLLQDRSSLEKVFDGEATWMQVFEEYARWMSPIGMAPRRIAMDFDYKGVTFHAEDRVFLMFGSSNRDEDVFDEADSFTVGRDTRDAVSFGAGPHFCAGARISRAMIADVALPMFFDAFPKARLIEPAVYGGWAFRGPLTARVCVS